MSLSKEGEKTLTSPRYGHFRKKKNRKSNFSAALKRRHLEQYGSNHPAKTFQHLNVGEQSIYYDDKDLYDCTVRKGTSYYKDKQKALRKDRSKMGI